MADERDEIRARINIVDLVGQTVSLKRSGKNYTGLCPFHQDRNPSFTVSPTTGRYKCWSCGEAGDIFTWIEKTQNVEFREALQILAQQAGVTLSQASKGDESIRVRQRAAMESALAFFRAEFDKCKPVQAYCERRNLGKEILDKWELGFAPDDGQLLTTHLKKQGFRLADCKGLFLVDGDERQGYYDKFRARLMFPIRDERGDLVGFGGRVLGDAHPKYINSSDTPLYRKSRVLYGMHVAKEHMRDSRTAVLVEGYLDVIACHTAGVGEAVASLGTSLADDQAKLLKRWVDGVTILYDSDAAGQKAAARATEILSAEALRVRVALVPEGKDPDTLLNSAGPEAVKKAVQSSLSPLAYRIATLENQYALEDEEFWKLAVAAIAESDSDLERFEYIDRLAPKYPNIRDKVEAKKALQSQVQRMRGARGGQPPQARGRVAARAAQIERSMHVSEVTIFNALIDPNFRDKAYQVLRSQDLLFTKNAMRLAEIVLRGFPNGPPKGPAASWVNTLESEAAKELFARIEADSRMTLSEAFVADTVQGLEKKREQRSLDEAFKDKVTDADLGEIHARLKKLKGEDISA